jgi:nitrogen fixation/metabolism regulation signal transduction histidine kinase
MVFPDYRAKIVLRILAILLNCLLLTLAVIYLEGHLYTSLLLLVLLIVQTYLLIRAVDISTRSIARFIEYARENNTTLSYRKELQEGAYRELGQVLDETNALIREARIEKENHYQYLQYIVRNAGVGILAYEPSGRVELCNEEALQILQLPALYDMKILLLHHEGFARFIQHMEPQSQKTYKLTRTGDILQLTVRCSEFTLQEKKIRLLSFRDIRSELEEQELESWQKLIRILTHEIMNTMTPINSLASALLSRFRSGVTRENQVMTEDEKGEIIDGLTLISERGTGLMEFIRRYKTLTRLPAPVFREISLNGLFSRMIILMKTETDEKNICLESMIDPENLSLLADERMLEQVLINLVRNSFQALDSQQDAKIILSAFQEGGKTKILVSDNGPGIPEELLSQVFIPFFTTRETGSGIGLSLARQIMQVHRGTIQAKPGVKKGTVIELEF